jgi:hypothetical protein
VLTQCGPLVRYFARSSPDLPRYDLLAGWQAGVRMIAEQLDDIRRQADVVAYDYERMMRMMREAKAANTDLDAAHVIAEHLALNPAARINWKQFLKLYRKRRK